MSEPEIPGECLRFEAEWNRLLDGEPAALSPDCAAHGHSCERCRALERGFAALQTYTGPELSQPLPAFGPSILRRQVQARAARLKRLRIAGGAAIAASLLAGVGLVVGRNARPIPELPPKTGGEVARITHPHPKVPDRESLQKAARQWGEIGTDVVTATRRAAGTPLEVSDKLLAMQPFREADALHGFQPVTQIFAEAGESALESLQPLRDTAESNLKTWWNGHPKSQ